MKKLVLIAAVALGALSVPALAASPSSSAAIVSGKTTSVDLSARWHRWHRHHHWSRCHWRHHHRVCW